MFIQSLVYIGANGDMLELLHNSDFYLTNVEGLTYVSADVASSTTPSMDGDTVNAVQAKPRDIVLTLRFRQGADVEMAKRRILKAVKPKLKGMLRMVQAERETVIEGIVTDIEMPRFSNAVEMQFTLHCSSPYWQDAEYIAIELSRVLDLHYFPIDEGGLAFPVDGVAFGVYDRTMTRGYTNEGDVECGMVITIIAVGDVVNPRIYKSDGSFIGVKDNMVAGDQIVIDTNKGKKSIIKNGNSVFSKVQAGSTFFQLDIGDNEITIDSDDGTEGNMYFTLSFKRRFV